MCVCLCVCAVFFCFIFYLFIFIFSRMHKKEKLVTQSVYWQQIHAPTGVCACACLCCPCANVHVSGSLTCLQFARLRTFLPLKREKVKITRVMPTVIHYICDSQGAQRSRHMSLITVSDLQITHAHTHAQALLQSLPLCYTRICMAVCVCVSVCVCVCVRLVCALPTR